MTLSLLFLGEASLVHGLRVSERLLRLVARVAATLAGGWFDLAWLGSRRGLQFSSLGDSVNNLNLKETQDHIFAHVLTASNRTFTLVEEAGADMLGDPKWGFQLLGSRMLHTHTLLFCGAS